MLKRPKAVIPDSKESKKRKNEGAGRDSEGEGIPESIEQVKERLVQTFSRCSDFIMREIVFGDDRIRAIIAFIDGFVDSQLLNQSVIQPILNFHEKNGKPAFDALKEDIIASGSVSEMHTFDDVINGISIGDALVLVDGESKALKMGIKAPEKRAVEQPDTEISIKGSREGFTENLRTNIILLRRRIRNPNFKVETMKLGTVTKTEVAICYIDGVVNEDILAELKDKLSCIKYDSVLGAGYIEQYIEQGRLALFPTVGNSEKPDKVLGKLLEGRIAVIVDGTPTALTVPFLMVESIQVPEDYFGEYYFATFMRILRVISLLVSMLLPALYVAMTAFHQTIIPFELMLTMTAAREGIPFSPFTEAILMTLTFEILREAGIRMPRAIGQAVSIVGAIVLGDAAVTAGIASASIVIVVALTGICSFINPPLMKPGVVLRIVFLAAANFLGLFGIALVGMALLIYLCNKNSFGIPYLSPFSPLNVKDLKDTLVVVPLWAMLTRPKALNDGKDISRGKSKISYEKE